MGNLFSQQIYKPLVYWTFDGKEALSDSTGNGNILRINGKYEIKKGQIRNGLFLSNETNDILLTSLKGGDINALNESFCYEMLFHYQTYKESRGDFFLFLSDAVKITFTQNQINFTTSHEKKEEKNFSHTLKVLFKGTDRNSLQYYTDDKWHHLVFMFDAKTGTKSFYVDGKCPEKFSVQQDSLKAKLTFSSKMPIRFNSSSAYNKTSSSFDEMAIYAQILPHSLIEKHYKDMENGKPYSFKEEVYAKKVVEKETTPTEAYDPKEFPPNYPNVSISALQQLRTFPLPRYKFSHSLLPNFNWVDLGFLSGSTDGTSRAEVAQNKIDFNFEIAKNWYHYLVLTQNTKAKASPDWVKQCNENPWFPIEVITFWAQTQPKVYLNNNAKMASIIRRDLPIRYYLNDGKGKILTEKPAWNPVMPIDSTQIDGKTQNFYFDNYYLPQLTRPIDIINENAEVITYVYPNELLEKSPEVVADKNKHFKDWDWYKYQSYKKYRLDSVYVSEIMKNPKLKNTIFTMYQVEGEHPQWRFDYNITKKVTTKIRGQYYATPDIYPVFHSNWADNAGPWHGWAWLPVCRTIEMAQGDKLFSPFVAAGWKTEEEKNLRPGRWLGLLKAINLMGAEFYYTGFFNEKAPFPSPRNYVWQMASTPYAQAITSRFQDILFNGAPLKGDLGFKSEAVPQYRFFTGNPQHLVVVRKHNTKNQYVISGSLQPNTVQPHSIALIDTVSIELEGQKLRFEIRQQGSTYIYDKTNSEKPIFYQLDKWHQYEHPSWWSHDFEIEAEVIDSVKSGSISIKTEVPKSANAGDFSTFTSFISGKGETGYLFQTRDIPAHKTLKLKIRARVSGGGTSDLQLQLDKNATDYKQPKKYTGVLFQANTLEIKGNEWKWYDLDKKTGKLITYSSLPFEEANMLWLKSANDKIEIDAIKLVAE